MIVSSHRTAYRQYSEKCIVVLVALTVVQGCASWVAETPEQRYFAARGEYGIVLKAAAYYAESPFAQVVVVEVLAEINRRANQVFAVGDAILGDLEGDEPSALQRATAGVLALVRELRDVLQEVN